MEELGIWNFVHGAGAGCASIVAWEGSHLFLKGAIAVVFYSVVTLGIMAVVHQHRKHLKRQLATSGGPSTSFEDEPTDPWVPALRGEDDDE